MTDRKQARPGIVRVNIEGIPASYTERRVGNQERFVVAMRADHSSTITVDADSYEMAEALALDFWRSRRLGGRPRPTLLKRSKLPETSAAAWELSELQDEIERAEQIVQTVQERRDSLIREAPKLRPVEAAEITGLSKGRISQIQRKG